VPDTRQTNNRVAERWFTCARCGNDYPESRVVQQKGFVRCTGSNTNGCADDEYGADYHRKRLKVPYERVPEDPPTRNWDDL
jgi:hypothetical protein